MNADGNEIEIITYNEIYYESSETVLIAFNKNEISAYTNQIKH